MIEVRQKIAPLVSPRWARGGHWQTLLGHFLPSPQVGEEGERLELEVSGADRIVARYLRGASGTSLYLFHGLGGFSHSSYMQRTARLARSLGHSVFMFNHRGCGEGARLAREPYHSGRAEDLSALIAYGRNLNPGHFHLAIGFSLSGNALLLLAAGQRADVLPDAAIAVNAPINLQRTAELLGNGFNRVYDFEFMREMRALVGDQLRLPLQTKLRDFDELYTAPRGGFKNREDYYSTCSAKQYLRDIEIPTVLITASDDPFVDVKDYLQAEVSPRALIHVEKEGGHMGYLNASPTPLGSRRWLDYALNHYIRHFVPS